MTAKRNFQTAMLQALKEQGMTQYQLADKVGVTAASMSLYCNGRIPRTLVFLRICDILHLNPALMTFDALEAERARHGN